MRVFLDTNVVISALATRGLCADLFRIVVAEHELVMGEVVIEETLRVPRERFAVPRDRVLEVEELLRSHEVVARPQEPASVKLRDESDRWVLANAMAARVDVLITGDADLLAVREACVVRIRTPREFWQDLRG